MWVYFDFYFFDVSRHIFVVNTACRLSLTLRTEWRKPNESFESEFPKKCL